MIMLTGERVQLTKPLTLPGNKVVPSGALGKVLATTNGSAKVRLRYPDDSRRGRWETNEYRRAVTLNVRGAELQYLKPLPPSKRTLNAQKAAAAKVAKGTVAPTPTPIPAKDAAKPIAEGDVVRVKVVKATSYLSSIRVQGKAVQVGDTFQVTKVQPNTLMLEMDGREDGPFDNTQFEVVPSGQTEANEAALLYYEAWAAFDEFLNARRRFTEFVLKNRN
jgi:hypothetical protein